MQRTMPARCCGLRCVAAWRAAVGITCVAALLASSLADPSPSTRVPQLLTASTRSVAQAPATERIFALAPAASEAGRSADEVDVRLTVFGGRADLCVRQTAQGAHCSQRHDSRVDGAQFAASVAVGAEGSASTVSVTTRDDQPATYRLTSEPRGRRFLASSHTLLQAGEPAGPFSIPDSNDLKYFEFAIGPGLQNGCVFTLTPLEGNPDMFVSTSNQFPSATSNSEWHSTLTQMDTVTVHPTDPGNCADGASHDCIFYVGVKATGGPVRFSVLAELDAGDPIVVVDGSQQFGELDQGQDALYSFTVPADASRVEVAVTPYYGDPDLYVNVGKAGLVETPSVEHSQYSSNAGDGEDMIRLDYANQRFVDCQATAASPGIGGGGGGGGGGGDGGAGRSTDLCTVLVLVHAYQASAYLIAITSNDQHTELADGVPAIGTVGAGDYSYFSFSSARENLPVYITVTPFSGDPDIYAASSKRTHRPTIAIHDWSSRSTGLDQVAIPADDPAKGGCVVCVYFVGVYGFTSNSSFSILAYVPFDMQPISLLEGQQQRGSVQPGDVAYYSFHLGTSGTDVEFVATALSGEVELFVTDEINPGTGLTFRPTVTCPAPPTDGTPCADAQVEHARWSSLASNSRARVSVSHYDRDYESNRVYVVAVYGVAFSGDAAGAIEFSVSAVTSAGVLTLNQGLPTEDRVAEGTYRFYRLLLDTLPLEADVTLTLTTFSGDADMYISETTQRPTRAQGDWAWRAFGTSQSETVTIQDADLPTCASRISNGQRCELWIGVYGYRNATYSLLGTVSDGSPTVLLDGIPQHGSAPRGGYSYYTATVPPGVRRAITIRVIPDEGDPDLFVSTHAGVRASDKHYDYASRQVGADVVTLSPSDSTYCSPCDISIAVTSAFATTSTYTITMSGSDSVISLLDGQLTAGFGVAQTYEYYSFHVGDPSADVHISLTPLSGDPDLVVSVEGRASTVDHYPTMIDNEWWSGNVGADSVFVSHTDDNYCYECNYIVGVYAFTNTSFMLSATAAQTPILRLVNGVPQTGELAVGSYAFFQYSQAGGTVEISVDSIDSSVDAYATNSYYGSGDDEHGQLPTRDSNLWSTTESHFAGLPRGEIRIDTSDAHYDPDHTLYTIAVWALQGGSFRITAQEYGASTATSLTVGVPVTNQYVAAGSTRHYAFTLDRTDADVQVVLTSMDGDADVVMTSRAETSADLPVCTTTGGRVLCDHYLWGEFSAGSGLFVVSHSNPCANVVSGIVPPCRPDSDFTAGRVFYVGVYGFTESHFSLLVTFSGQHVGLSEGRPQQMTTGLTTMCPDRAAGTNACQGEREQWISTQAAFAIFSVSAAASRGDVTLQLARDCSTHDGACDKPLHVYVSACSPRACLLPKEAYPWHVYNRFAFTLGGGATDGAFVVPQEHAFCSDTAAPCVYYVSVTTEPEEGMCALAHCPQQRFSITATTEAGSEVIRHSCMDGHLCSIPTATLVPGQRKQFEAYLGPAVGSPGGPTECRDMHVQLRSCSGSPSLAMCWGGNASTCSDRFHPGPPPDDSSGSGSAGVPTSSNADTTLTASADDHGVAQWTHECAYGTWFMTVLPDASSELPQQFELGLSSGNDLELVTQPAAAVTVARGASHYAVHWGAVKLRARHDQTEQAADGARYAVYSIPQGTLGDGAVLWTPCGVRAAANGVILTTTTSLSATFDPPEHDVWIAVVAVCDDACMPDGERTQDVAFAPVQVAQFVPDDGSGLGGGWVFVIVVLVVGALAGGAFGLRWHQKKGEDIERGGMPVAEYEQM